MVICVALSLLLSHCSKLSVEDKTTGHRFVWNSGEKVLFLCIWKYIYDNHAKYVSVFQNSFQQHSRTIVLSAKGKHLSTKLNMLKEQWQMRPSIWHLKQEKSCTECEIELQNICGIFLTFLLKVKPPHILE